METASKILSLLNDNPSTITELSEELGISRNSVHQQLSKLEAAGAIRKSLKTGNTGAGKPAGEYRLQGGHEDRYSLAHKSVLDAMVQTIGEQLTRKQRQALLRGTGYKLARSSDLKPSDDVIRDIDAAVAAVNELGAMAKLTHKNNVSQITCFNCPVGTIVHSDPMTCQMVAAFFSGACGRHVSVNCKRQDTVVCGFTIDHDHHTQ